jgi:hypothetical protein
MRSFFLFLSLSLCSSFVQSQNLYQVFFPNDTTVVGCGATIDTTYPTVIQLDYNCAFSVGISVKDQTYGTASGGACTMIYRKFHLIWWCNYDPNTAITTTIPNPSSTTIGASAFGNAQNHGDLEYTQIIKILDNDGPQFTQCPTGMVTACDYSQNDPAQWHTNHLDYCEGPVKLETSVTDLCSGSNLTISYKLFLDTDNNGTMETTINSNSLGSYPLIKQVVNDTLKAKIDFSPNKELPYGRHKIQWIAKDHCGHQSVCQYEFIVKDCAAPTIICLHGISVNLMPGGMITIPEADILQYTYDNCSPIDQIKTGVRIAGTGTGFPINQHEVNLTCANIGVQAIQVWAQDAFGNSDYCTATINVQDHIGACTIGNKSGQLTNAKGQALANIMLDLKTTVGAQTAGQWQTNTDASGKFKFTDVPICDLELAIAPTHQDITGINAADALTLARHLLGLEAVIEPVQILAADINGDQQINQADLDQLSSQILSNQAMVKPWLLWFEGFSFPTDPLQAVLPSNSELVPCTFGDSILLKLAKCGDINASWASGAAHKSGTETAVFKIEDQTFSAGQTVEFQVISPDLDGLPAFQLALTYDQNFTDLINVIPDLVAPDLVTLKPLEHTVNCLWFDPYLEGGPVSKGMHVSLFTISFTAKQAGKLSDMFRINQQGMVSTA